jgi:phosphomannomutase/phosphoglucomutase
MKKEIFRAYDIRGIAEEDLGDEVVVPLGRALGTYFLQQHCRTITLGRDCRLSSDRIGRALREGLVSTGLNVIDLGTVPTPLLYYSLHRLPPDGGIMITGSHNPAQYNGFKVAVGKTTIHGEQIQEVRRIAEDGNFASGNGEVSETSLFEDYRDYLRESFGSLPRQLKVVVDCGNGTASLVAPDAFRALGCDVTCLYCEMDGRFPNHHPDPTIPENLTDLVKRVGQEGAHLGIAFDGDADRIGVVDESGTIIWGDHLMILYSRDLLKAHPGAAIIGEVKCSVNLYDDIQKHGGRPIMWKTGHSLIKTKMKEEGALLAGEMSGHIFFADRFFGYDDATYAACRLLEILAQSGQSLSQLLADVPTVFNTPELRVDVPEAIKFEIVRRATEWFGKRYETVTVDGVRILFEEGWGLIRASNTQPALVLRFEAKTSEGLKTIRSHVEAQLKSIIEAAPTQ